MKARFEVETVDGLRDRLTRDAVRWQAEAAALWKAVHEDWSASEDVELVIAFQQRLERNYRCARELVEWISDAPFLATWCKRINRSRRKDAQKRQRRLEAEAKRWAAMTPRQRHQAVRAAESVRIMVDGLVQRDVQ